MSKNVKAFLRGAVWNWLVKNAQISDIASSLDKERFFVVPVALNDPSYATLSRSLIKRFSSSKTLSTKTTDEYIFRKISEGDSCILLVCRSDGLTTKVDDSLPFDFELGDATFLQRMDFITEGNLSAPAPIPRRLVIDAVSQNSPVFEADLEPYLPQVISWRISNTSPYYSDEFEVVCARILINLADRKTPVRVFSDLLIKLALVMPIQNHGWLFDQLYFTLTSRKPEHLYLGLYQLLEFFFPLKGVSALKKALGYKGSFLQLREFCSNALGWNINHHTGARAAASLCTKAFADICLDRVLPANSTDDAVEKHKIDAISKISELRHLLAHQGFSARKSDEEGLNIKTEALLSLLIDAFSAYKQHQ